MVNGSKTNNIVLSILFNIIHSYLTLYTGNIRTIVIFINILIESNLKFVENLKYYLR